MNLRNAHEFNPPRIPTDIGVTFIKEFEDNGNPANRWPMHIIARVVDQLITNQYMPRINEILGDYYRELDQNHSDIIATRDIVDRNSEDTFLENMPSEER